MLNEYPCPVCGYEGPHHLIVSIDADLSLYACRNPNCTEVIPSQHIDSSTS
jgi:hypothetical protein